MQHLRRDDGHFVAKELRTALETSRKEACRKKICQKGQLFYTEAIPWQYLSFAYPESHGYLRLYQDTIVTEQSQEIT